jgi:hypothetical protein
MPGVAVGAADFALVLAPCCRDVSRLGGVALGAVVVAESGSGGNRLCCGGLGGGFGEGRGCGEQQPGDEEQ